MQVRKRRMVLVGYVHWIIIIVNIMFELMGFSKLPIFLLLLCLTYNQSPCYVSCSNGGCLSSNALACTRCDVGTVLINQRCAIAGSQSEPIKILTPNSLNVLDVSTLLSTDNSTREQIGCTAATPGQTAVMTFLNLTRTQAQVYTYRLPQIFINSPHQFVNIKFNSILFNRRTNPKIKVLVIDENNRRIFDNTIESNQSTFTCSRAAGQIPASNGFYVVINLPTTSRSILFQISTTEPGDQLGVSDIQFFYGNCNLGCATCQGPGGNQCLSCLNLLDFNSNQKACSGCPPQFYMINAMCYPCPYNCQTCVLNPKSGSPQCTKCLNVSINGSIPNCRVTDYVNQSFQAIRFNDSEGWKSTSVLSNLATVCGSYSLIGGLPSGLGGSTLFKTFTNLPAHNKIWLKFTLFLIDQVTGSTYRAFVDVDGVRVLDSSISIDSSVMNTSECGTQRQQFVSSVMVSDVIHSGLSAKIEILGLGNYFGIRDFVLGVVNITESINCALTNANNQCIRCKNGFAVNKVNQNNNQAPICSMCPEGTYQKNGTCVPCPIYCKTCKASATEVLCTSCDLPLTYNKSSSSCNDQGNNLYTVALSQQWSNQTSKDWQLYPKLQNEGIDFCGESSILGSTQLRYRSLSMKRVFKNLPVHQGVSIHLFFYQIDDFDGILNDNNLHSVNFKLDQVSIPYKISRTGYDMCGNSSYDSVQKLVLVNPSHKGQTLTFQVQGNKTKFGISNVLLFLTKCNCVNNGIAYQLETIPIYSVETDPSTNDRGLRSKIIFTEKVKLNTDEKNIFNIKLVNITKENPVSQSANSPGKATGERAPYEVLTAELYAGRELRMLQNLIKDQYNKSALGNLVAPDLVYGFAKVNGQTFIKTVRLMSTSSNFSRYDDLHLDASGSSYRANIRNLMNLFRGISILALFIGLISFFFGLSNIFDDLFIMCQIIFVHIFIQGSWISATMQLPVGAMNLVQFMAWLPIEARNGIENAIIPLDHYQRSPIVYEQYWKDITFARTIYHTVIFLAATLLLFWIIRLIQTLRAPSINNLMDLTKQKLRFAQNFYYNYVKHWFVFLDQVIRFTFFTVMWAACLQFIHFFNEPTGFMGWNSALCIVMFVAYLAYVGLGFYYINSQAGITQEMTFKEKFDGIRLKKSQRWYFIFKYLKWLAIAFIIGQTYKANPLAALIPLMAIHLTDAIIILVKNPYIEDSGQSERIVSKCTKNYWFSYRISHIVENFLFFILELVMIIMYGVRSYASKEVYLSVGYACCAFIIMMFINGLVRLVWGFVRSFEVCYEDVSSRDQEIKTEEDLDPLKFQDIYRANNFATLPADTPKQNNTRRPSIEGQMGR